MTPQEKANDLIHRHLNINLSQVDDLCDGIRIRLAQENAIITSNEVVFTIINGLDTTDLSIEIKEFWIEVQKELKELKNATKP